MNHQCNAQLSGKPRNRFGLSGMGGHLKCPSRSGRGRVLHLESLEERRLLSVVSWINSAGGAWEVGSNWSNGAGPGASDDVSITGVTGTITHSTGTDTVHSIEASAPITLSGGKLSVVGSFSDSSAVTLAGGTLANANIAEGTTLVAASSTSSLDDVTLSGLLNMQSSAFAVGVVRVTDTAHTGAGLTLQSGSVLMDAYTGLTFAGTQTLAGSGTVTAYYSSVIGLSDTNQTLTIAAGITLKSSGASLDVGSNTLLNQGTLSGDGSVGAGSGFTINGTNWVNDGTIQAINDGTVTLAGSWTNSGTISLNSGTVNLRGTLTRAALGTVSRDVANPGTLNLVGTLNLASQTLEAAIGALTLAGGTINGGIVSDTVLVTSSGTNTLNDVTLSGLLHLLSSAFTLGTVQVSDTAHTGAGLTLQNGSILMDAYTGLTFAGTQTLAGSGTVTAYYSTVIGLSGTDQTLTIAPGITIASNGSLDVSNSTLINQGTLSSVGSVGVFTVNGTNWVNDGTIQAINSGTVTLAGSWTNSGTMKADGGTMNANGSGSNSGTMRQRRHPDRSCRQLHQYRYPGGEW